MHGSSKIFSLSGLVGNRTVQSNYVGVQENEIITEILRIIFIRWGRMLSQTQTCKFTSCVNEAVTLKLRQPGPNIFLISIK